MFFRRLKERAKALTLFAWTDGIPTVVPNTDWIGFAQFKRKGIIQKKERQIRFIQSEALLPLVRDYLVPFDKDSFLLPEENVVKVSKIFQNVTVQDTKEDFEMLTNSTFIDFVPA